MTTANKPEILPHRISEPRAVMTIFGWGIINGPFIDDYTTFNWTYTDHWSGEVAEFRFAGMRARVKDYDGDASGWVLRDMRTDTVIAEGEDHGHKPNHFIRCLVEAEEAIRIEVRSRKSALQQRLRGYQPQETK